MISANDMASSTPGTALVRSPSIDCMPAASPAAPPSWPAAAAAALSCCAMSCCIALGSTSMHDRFA